MSLVLPAGDSLKTLVSLEYEQLAPFHIGHHGQMRNPRSKIDNVIYSVQKATSFKLNRTDMNAAADLNGVGTSLIVNILDLWS